MRFLVSWLVKFALKIAVIFMLFSILIVILFRFMNPPASMLMAEQKIANWDGKQIQVWKDWNEISDNIKIAVIATEDQHFIDHFGIDLNAIEQAITYNSNNKSIRGASTITQQVAKNTFLWSSRSWVRKGFELWFTLWIELFWSKQRILEVYLNSAEWGKGIFGIEAASRHYFNISAKNLTAEQASLLAAILPNPRNLNPIYPNNQVQARANWIQKQIKNLDKTSYLNKLK